MKLNLSTISTIGFIAGAAATRFISSLPNFSVFEALALFGGTYLASRYKAVLIPIAAMFFTDLVLNNTVLRSFYPESQGLIIFQSYMIWNYLAMALIVMLGSAIFHKVNVVNVLGGLLGASLIFFLITNFGSWLTNPLYPRSFAGLMESYVAGIYFWKNSLLGNLIFGGLLFGSYELFKRYFIRFSPKEA